MRRIIAAQAVFARIFLEQSKLLCRNSCGGGKVLFLECCDLSQLFADWHSLSEIADQNHIAGDGAAGHRHEFAITRQSAGKEVIWFEIG